MLHRLLALAVLVALALAGASARAVPNPAHAAAPLPATDRSAQLEAQRDAEEPPKPTVSAGNPCKVGMGCQSNAECPCTSFCFFSRSEEAFGKCLKYERDVHAA